MSAPPVMAPATAEDAGRNCPYCRFPLKEGGDVARCGSCHAAHHADCWSDNRGCAVMGCAAAPGSAIPTPAALAAPVPPVQAPTVVQPAPRPAYAPQPTYQAPPPPYQPPPTPSGGGGGRWLIGAILVLAVVVAGAAVAIVLTREDDTTPAASSQSTSQAEVGSASDADAEETVEPEPTVEDIPEPEPTVASPSDLLSRPRAEMRREIQSMLLNWHESIVAGDASTAWDMLTERKRDQKASEEGYSAWAASQVEFGNGLSPSGLRVSIDDIDDPENVVRVNVRGMYYEGCEWRGITWVRWEGGEWLYEPGYSTTSERRREWEPRAAETLGGSC